MNRNQTEKKHDGIVECILREPQLIGISRDQIISSQKEYEMYLNNKRHVTPDLYFAEECNVQHYLEVKSANSKCCFRKARSQIERMLEYLDSKELIESSIVGLIYPQNLRLKRFKIMEFRAQELCGKSISNYF